MVFSQAVQGYVRDAIYPPVTPLPSSSSDTPSGTGVQVDFHTLESPRCLSGGVSHTRNGDGFQSPQTRYFEDPVIDDALPYPVCSGMEAQMEHFPGESFGHPMATSFEGDMDQFGDDFGAASSLNPTGNRFPCVPHGATLVRLVPCVPVLLRPLGPWANPYRMDAAPKGRTSNRAMKKGHGKDTQFGNNARADASVWSAKSKSRSSFPAGAATSRAASHAKGKGAPLQRQLPNQTWDCGSSGAKDSDKSQERPSSVFIDLSCLRPQRRIPSRFVR